MKRLKQNQKNILILAGLIVLCLLMRLHRFDSIYTWDEMEYRLAANLGLKVNYLDQNSLDFSYFIKKGFIKYYHLGDHLITYPGTVFVIR
jgi:hypothetical protein